MAPSKIVQNLFRNAFHPATRVLNRIRNAVGKGDWESAYRLMVSARNKFPNRADVNLIAAQLEFERGDHQKACVAIDKVLSSTKSRLDQLADAVRLCEQKNERERAIQLYEKIGRNHPKWNVEHVWNSIGYLHLKDAQYSAALSAFAECVCRGGRAPWVALINLLDDCDPSDVDRCRESLLARSMDEVESYRFHKFISLLDHHLAAHGLGDVRSMIARMRMATEFGFKSLYPNIKIDPAAAPLKPAFVIIGAMKCGTTTLHQLISQHPDCLTLMEKEIQFFQFPQLKEAWYLEHFPRVTTTRKYITGEASPGYYIFDTVDRIQRVLPEVKLLFIQRNPAYRAISHIKHNMRLGIASFQPDVLMAGIDRLQDEIESAPQQAEKIILDITTGRRQQSTFTALGCYDLLLRRWRRDFGPDRLMTVQLEQLSDTPQKTMEQVFNFLALPPFRVEPVMSNAGNYDEFDGPTQRLFERYEAFYARLDELMSAPSSPN